MYKVTRKMLQGGQALLIVLLAMAVILAVVLSVASRSITDVSITSSEEDALRAFSAAEAGIEQSLLSGTGSTGNPAGDPSVSFNSIVSTPSQGLTFVYPASLYPGDAITFWFATRDANGNFTTSGSLTKNKIQSLCWGSYQASSYTVNADKPAVLLSVFYDTTRNYITGDYNGVKVARLGFDPNSSRSLSNNFLTVSGGSPCRIGNQTFAFQRTNIHFSTDLGLPGSCDNTPGCLIMARVKVFYNNPSKPEQVGIEFVGGPGTGLPAQGNVIESTGLAGESTRKVNVFQSFSEPPPIFDSAIFSLSDISK